MDQGVIEWLKRRYSKKSVGSLLDKTEGGCALLEAMKVLNTKDAIYTVASAWDEMKKATLQKAWKKIWPSLKQSDSADKNDDKPTSSTEVI